MPKITFSARSAKGRVRNVSARPRLGQDAFRDAFADARPLGRLPGGNGDPPSLAAIGEVVPRTLRSSGGRPALEGSDAVPMRVSLMHGDRAKIEIIASHVHPRTSPSQMVAVLCHLALAQIPEDQIVDTLSQLNGEGRSQDIPIAGQPGLELAG